MIVSAGKAVTLDLWQTLIGEDDGTARSPTRREARVIKTARVIADRGVILDSRTLERAFDEAVWTIDADHALGLDMRYHDRVAQTLAHADPNLPVQIGLAGIADAADAIDEAFEEHPPKVLAGVHETLETLKSTGLKIGLISNTGFTSADAYRRWFKREGILDYFDEMAFSNQLACAKPNPDIYHPTIEALDVTADETLHVGDNLHTDIAGAAQAGMSTVWISGYDHNTPAVAPDYTIAAIAELAPVVEQWLNS